MAVGLAPNKGEFCTCHGSYIPQHVILRGNRTVALDLDDYFLAPPSRDVAYFMVGIQRLAEKCLNSFHELDWIGDAFLASYVRASSHTNAVLERLPLARAAEYMHLAKKRAAAIQSNDWRERTEAMLQEVLQALRPGLGKRAVGKGGS